MVYRFDKLKPEALARTHLKSWNFSFHDSRIRQPFYSFLRQDLENH
jgi:hypothetical protein